MSSTVIISFEDNLTKVVYGSAKKSGFEVSDTLVLKEGEFEAFLEKEKTKEFVVVSSFKNTFQELIQVPVTKKKYLKKLLELEIQKKWKLKDFTYIYHINGEKLVNGKIFKEVFVYAVCNLEIEGIINSFSSKGKRVKALYPDIFSVAKIVDSGERPALCVTEAGLSKTLFLVNEGNICFARKAQGNELGIDDFDIQNIEMSVNYCRQSLRINPETIMLTGSICSDFNYDTFLSVPLACLVPPYKLKSPGKAQDFLVPISALGADARMNILPAQYRLVRTKRNLLRISGGTFAALSVALVVIIGAMVGDVLETRSNLSTLYRDFPEIEAVVSSFDREKAAIDAYGPIVDLVNTSASNGIEEFLITLSGISTKNVTLNNIGIAQGHDWLRCRIEGIIDDADYANAQASYDLLITSISKLRSVTLTEHTLDIKDMRFLVELEYI